MKGDFWILEEEKESEMFSRQIKTVGNGGLMFVSSVPLSVGTHLRVRLFDGSHDITFLSKVVWTKPVENSETTGFIIGLQYDPSDQVSLLDVDFFLKIEKDKRKTFAKSDNPKSTEL